MTCDHGFEIVVLLPCYEEPEVQGVKRYRPDQRDAQMADGKARRGNRAVIFLVIDGDIFSESLFSPIKKKNVDRGPNDEIRNRRLMNPALAVNIFLNGFARYSEHLPGREQKTALDVRKEMKKLMQKIDERDSFCSRFLPAMSAVRVAQFTSAVLAIFHS